MFVANIATLTLAKAHMFAFWLLQQATDDAGSIGWDPIHLWKQMSWVAQVVVIILFIMSAWSIGVMIDRWIAFSAARTSPIAHSLPSLGDVRIGTASSSMAGCRCDV